MEPQDRSIKRRATPEVHEPPPEDTEGDDTRRRDEVEEIEDALGALVGDEIEDDEAPPPDEPR